MNMNRKSIEIMYEVEKSLLEEASAIAASVNEKFSLLSKKEMDYSGWVGYADTFPEEELEEIIETADRIAKRCKYFVVIGIGGSYLGAKAALSYIGHPGSVDTEGRPEVLFAGFNLSGAYHAKLIDKIRDGDICLLIISKSGGTLEPSVAFQVLKSLLIEKYGKEEAMSRIYAITDSTSGKLREEAKANGYKAFVLPSDIGGRYSVLTPVGLLPLSVAGVDVRAILEGAKAANSDHIIDCAKRLACVRSVLEKSKCVEAICHFEPAVEDFAAWLLQLYGESEGKDGRGALPVGIGISRDLHSLGQFLQEGKQVFYETLLFVADPSRDLVLGKDAGEYAGRSYHEFNKAVLEGMAKAHRSAGIPLIRIYIPDNSAHTFGVLVYFFELCCALTGLLMGVNPFNQPGVEAYKKAMLEYLAP